MILLAGPSLCCKCIVVFCTLFFYFSRQIDTADLMDFWKARTDPRPNSYGFMERTICFRVYKCTCIFDTFREGGRDDGCRGSNSARHVGKS